MSGSDCFVWGPFKIHSSLIVIEVKCSVDFDLRSYRPNPTCGVTWM